MLERILRMVVLPAPLCPTIPKASPSLTSKLTSLRAHMGSDRLAKGCLYQRLGELLELERLYFFDTRSNLRSIIALSYHISHGGF